MKPLRFTLPAVAAIALGLCAAASSASAQDSFDDKLPARRAPAAAPAPAPAQQAPGRAADKAPANPLPASPAGESRDFGVKPTAQLRPSEQLHGPTPTSIPGGRVVSTPQLVQWMQGQQGAQGRVLLLHTIGSAVHLPNAIAAVPAAQGGSFDDQVQREFGNYLQQATGGDKSRLIVTYCAGVQCWGSYNAALRAIRMGYKNVHWYRGGMEAWEQAGQPLAGASGENNGQQGQGQNSAPR